jgi:tetratricopeptide (TPR) repeat protein
MKVAFHLRKRSTPEPAHALLLTSPQVGNLLALCGRLGLDPCGRVFALPDGFLVKLVEATTATFPRAIRLRRLTENLFLPVDADLVPTLLDDEAKGLVRDRGLVFLPGGRVLGFALDQPLKLSQLLSVGSLRRRDWQPLAVLAPLADSLKEILLELPRDSPDDLLAAGGAGIGTDAPQPAEANPATTAIGQATLAAGRGLFHLGQALGLKKLAELGAKWMNRALSMAPRLSEAVLGRQEAALRELLRQFREGDLESALRRALPLGASEDRGGVADTGANLPVHNLLYSLGNILGGRTGPASVWLGGYDVQRELRAEYHKAAEQAIQRGDYRRAAFIYGKLLRDYRTAANVLMQGGLHHDAAILFLDKVGDVLAAARAFEAAGEIDRAVQLYRQKGEHVLAGDLLRRAGDEDAAIDEYQQATEKMIAAGQGYCAAGELMLSRVGRSDLAILYFEKGWVLRPYENAFPCALKLMQLYAEQESPERLLHLVSEAEVFFQPTGHEHAAGQFFNALAEHAERPNLSGLRDDLRDRSLLALATKLRQRAAVEERPGYLVSSLVGESDTWAPALVNDARVAYQTALKRPRRAAPDRGKDELAKILVHPGIVTAACFAPATGEVFLGYHSGQIASFRPQQEETVKLPYPRASRVMSLATDPEGKLVVALRDQEPENRHLSSYTRGSDGRFQLHASRTTNEPANWLTPIVHLEGNDSLLSMWDGKDLQILRGPSLILMERLDNFAAAVSPTIALYLPITQRRLGEFNILMVDRNSLFHLGSDCLYSVPLCWKPSRAPGVALEAIPISWWQDGPEKLELAGIGEMGTLYWSALQFNENRPQIRSTNSLTGGEPYLAATILRSSCVAAITRSRIDWLRCGQQRFSLIASEKAELPSSVACFPSPATNELIIVCGDGFVARVAVPN